MGKNDDLYTLYDIDGLFDIIFHSVDEQCEQKRKAVAYLYLKMSVILGIPLVETFRRYDWIESPPPVEPFKEGNGRLVSPVTESYIYLVERMRPLTFEMPYREAAFNVVELVRKTFKLPEDNDYGLEFQRIRYNRR